MSEIPNDIQEMAERIQKKKEEIGQRSGNVISNKSLGAVSAFQVSVELISGVLIGAGIGYILDELFDFHSVLLLTFIILGGFAGMLNVYRYVKKIDEQDERIK